MELVITVEGSDERRLALYGIGDCHLRAIRDALGIKLFARDSTLKLVGEPDAVGKAALLFERMQERLKQRGSLEPEDVTHQLSEIVQTKQRPMVPPVVMPRGAPAVRPRTPGQERYVQAIEQSDLCFCVGPAGTGKTYLAVAMALSLLKVGKLKRIVLARPAVEAGEKLGYLPGDLQAKVNPYLRPLFDAMHDMMEFEQIKRFMVNDIIEVIPLAFMRGRTLNNAAIILDEAQNATMQQMLMFLTRLGHHSKMIVTGDDSQSDLDKGTRSGLVDAVERLRGISGISVIRLDKEDIVRHPLVSDVVRAYGNGTAGTP